MKSLFDKHIQAEIIERIKLLNESSVSQWGKMNVSQMVRHCNIWEEMIHSNIAYPRPLIGKLLGKFMLARETKDERQMGKNNPTLPVMVIKALDLDLEKEKQQWVEHIHSYKNYSYPDYSFVHPFFGKMTRKQVGILAYKHTDHHLRQFGS